MNRSQIVRCGLVAVAVLGWSGAAFSYESSANLLAIGPVELAEASQVTVLGRVFAVRDASALHAGDKVAVYGLMLPDGSMRDVTVESLGHYTAGSDTVYEKGVVTHVEAVTGQLNIGKSEIDYTAALAQAGANTPKVGELVSVAGTQPAAQGVILASTTSATTGDLVAMLGTSNAASPDGAVSNMPSPSDAKAAFITGGGRQSQFITGGGRQSQFITGGGRQSQFITGGGRQSQ